MIKWWQWILIIIGAIIIFYNLYPKYHFPQNEMGVPHFRCNKITGRVERVFK